MGSTAKFEIHAQECPNPDFMVFHLNREVSRAHVHDFWFPLTSVSDGYMKDIGEVGEKLVRGIAAVSGTTRVYIKRFEISVEKAKLFGWDRIGPSVIRVIKKSLHRRKVTITGPEWAQKMSSRAKAAESKPDTEGNLIPE